MGDRGESEGVASDAYRAIDIGGARESWKGGKAFGDLRTAGTGCLTCLNPLTLLQSPANA